MLNWRGVALDEVTCRERQIISVDVQSSTIAQIINCYCPIWGLGVRRQLVGRLKMATFNFSGPSLKGWPNE